MRTFIVIILAWFFSVSFVRASPAAVYVDTSYTAGNSGGHFFGIDAFVKIQDGVNAVSAGGTVSIAAGIYDEQVFIDGKGLTMKGAGDATIIQPSEPGKLTALYIYKSVTPPNPDLKAAGIIMVRHTGASAVIIKDLAVDGVKVEMFPNNAERLFGILYGESSGTIQNVTVNAIKTKIVTDRANGIGVIVATGHVLMEIIGNRIYDFRLNGILAIGKNLAVDIRNNIITGPEVSPEFTYGIALLYGPGGAVRDNIINRFYSPDNSWRSSGISLYGDGFNPLVIEGNEIFDADYGISLSAGVNDSIIRANYLHDNKTGVMLESGATNNKIVANTITKNMQGFQIHGNLSSNPTGNKPPGAGNAAYENMITENDYGIISFDGAQSFNAANNWWGSTDPDFNKIISGSVIYSPWLATKNIAPSPRSDSLPKQDLDSSLPVTPKEAGAAPEIKKLLLKKDFEEEPRGETSLEPDRQVPYGAGPEGEQVPSGASVEDMARLTPEEPTALFDLGAGPGEEQISKSESDIKTSSANLVTRIAPGELLPISVKLVNFGGRKRVDVTIEYYILNEKGDVVLTEKETVAVETTASFIKILQIPRDIEPGQYTAESSITYQGQKVPATASYQFTVERKIAGIFASQFVVYAAITLFLGIVFAAASQLLKKNSAEAALRHMSILR